MIYKLKLLLKMRFTNLTLYICLKRFLKGAPVETEVVTREEENCPVIRTKPKLCPPRYSIDSNVAFIRTYTGRNDFY